VPAILVGRDEERLVGVSGLTTMAMRSAQCGHLRNGPVLSWLMRGLSRVASQAEAFPPGRSE